MKQIKTVLCRADNAPDFDKAVNALLRDGWTLAKRDIVQAVDTETYVFHRILYAELEREE